METRETTFDFEEFFRSHYPRIARAVARVVGEHARAEDIAVEAFWKLSRDRRAQAENPGGWLYRTAIRLSLNEVRRAERRRRYERLASFVQRVRTPEEDHAATEERYQVRTVLALLDRRQAEMLLLRSSGLSYAEVGAALEINPASVGTLLSRAQQSFRKEYLKRYGPQTAG